MVELEVWLKHKSTCFTSAKSLEFKLQSHQKEKREKHRERDRNNCNLRPAQAKSSQDLISTNKS
jgi:hypothetical protein